MRLVEAFEDFEAYLQASKKSPNTLKAYRADLRMVADVLVDPTGRSVDELQLEDLTVSNLRRAFATRAEHTAASSLARTHTTWTRLCRFLRSEGLIDVNPMDEIEQAKLPRNRPKSIEDDQVAARLLAAAADQDPAARSGWPTRDTVVVATLVTTGVRLAELVALNVGSKPLREAAHHLPQQVVAVCLELLAQPRQRVHPVRDHRVPPHGRLSAAMRLTR